jgi:UrcA family protein
MNVTTLHLFARLRLSIAAGAAVLTALQSIGTAGAPSQQPASPVLDKRVAVVSLADLDISTPQGAQAARDRLQQTARRLCSQLQDSRDLGHQPHFVACVDRAMASTLRQIRGPAVAAVDGMPAGLR